MNDITPGQKFERWSLAAIFLILFLRVITLGFPDIVDTTEGRYASISKHMLESGDFVTPQIPLRQEGWVPYLGKPPLYFWVGSTAIKYFGANEWAARLPSLLSAILLAVTVYSFGRMAFGATQAAIAVLTLQTMAVVFITSGVVMLDMTVAAFMGVSLLGFYCVTIGRGNAWPHYLLFVGAALGFLTKGPIALVLTGGAIVLWAIVKRDYSWIGKIYWVRGLLLFLVLVAPWFYFAEKSQPGFMRYFFVNENFLRFVTRNYEDKYGSGHVYPRGSALVLMLTLSIPWSFILLGTMWKRFSDWKVVWREKDSALMLCFAWALFPALFFSAARQLTPLYILPSLGGLALCVGYFWIRLGFNSLRVLKVALGLAIAFAIGTVASGPFISQSRSTKGIMTMIKAGAPSLPTKVAVPRGNPFSAYFYSNLGEVELQAIDQDRLLGSDINNLIIKSRDKDQLSAEILAEYQDAGEWGKYLWMKRTTGNLGESANSK